MSEIPEIEAIRGCRWFARPETIVTDEQRAECEEVVDVEDATRLLRTALDRQAREIVEALRERSFPDGIDPDGGSLIVGMDDVEAVVADRSWRRCLLAVRRARRIGRRGICTVPDFPSELVEAAAKAAMEAEPGQNWECATAKEADVYLRDSLAVIAAVLPLIEQRVIDRLARETDGRVQRLQDAIHAADRELITIADFSIQEAADAIDSVRAGLKDALAETDVPAPDDARSVPDPVLCAACGGTGHRNGNRRAADPFGTCPGCDGTGKASRRIIVYDARAGRCGLTVPVGCTVGDAAWLAVAAMGVRVGPDDCPSLAVNGSGLHPANPLPDDLDFELVVIGGTV